MRKFIEELLEARTKETGNEIYYTQWQACKGYMTDVLSLIAHTFPHFSPHDDSHADAILNNIVRIIGKETLKEHFTIVDLWLLLNAAYYHDCGMAILGKDKKEAFQTDSNFVKYVQKIQKDPHSPLRLCAECFEIKKEEDKATLCYKQQDFTTKSNEAGRYLLAGYYRSQHANRSSIEIGKDSKLRLPGNAIPERLYYWLGEICRVHTCDFQEAMTLPYAENGCGDEDCHPRYIACLLRIGDLLDIDNNRVSDIVLSSLDFKPLDSEKHQQMTAAIRRLQVNTREISIVAYCDKYEVAELTNDWFKWIDEEIAHQQRNWNDIVPDAAYGYLPTIGDLKVNLEGYETFDGKSRPRFQIDSQKAVELLQGAGIYKDSSQSIRELLQNSVDATYLRIWKEYKSDEDSLKSFKEKIKKHPAEALKEFKTKCQEKEIKIRIRRKEENEAIRVKDDVDESKSENYETWTVEIEDQGLGMSKEDLKFLTCTGSSSRNEEKQELIEEMPDWMRPSGIFGIGFQSVFLLADKVHLTTKKYGKEQAYTVDLYNPIGSERGNILIQKVSSDAVKWGTKLWFELKLNTNRENNKKELERHASAYDFTKEKCSKAAIIALESEIRDFITDALPAITYNREGEVVKTFSSKEKANKWKNPIFYPDLGLEIEVDLSEESDIRDETIACYYRNQVISPFGRGGGQGFFRIDINLLRDTATEVLELNRNNIKESYKKGLKKRINRALIRLLLENYSSLKGEVRAKASLMIEAYKKGNKIEASYLANYVPSYKDYKFRCITAEGKNEDVNIGCILEYEHILFYPKKNFDENFFQGLDNAIVVRDAINCINPPLGLFVRHLLTPYKYIEFTSEGILVSKQIPDNPCYISDWNRWFDEYAGVGTMRLLMPCPSEYAALQVEEIDWSEEVFWGVHLDTPYPRMICPYVRKIYDIELSVFLKYDVDEKVIDFTYQHRTNKSVTKEEIKAAYELFRTDIESEVAWIKEGKPSTYRSVRHGRRIRRQ